MKNLPAAPAAGPAFIRRLARLTGAEVPSTGPALSQRLGQWIDWNRAVALSRALDGPPAPATPAPAFGPADAAECARVRDGLAAAIDALHGDTPVPEDAADIDAWMHAETQAARKRYLEQQRALQAATGRLRGRLRDQLATVSPEMARLADVDAVMEATLSPREHALLGAVPALLEDHARRTRAGQDTAAAAVLWRDALHQALRDLLQAELDVRFQPIDGLLAALHSR